MGARDLMAVATMTSREIADLVDSRHDTVKVCIERLIAKRVISEPSLTDGEKSANGIVERLYVIGKRDSYVIVAQLSPEFTGRLVDRWQALEAGLVAPVRSLTTAEMFLQNAQIIVGIEQSQAAQALELIRIGSRVEQLADTQVLLTRPSASESISHIRDRINTKYGIPARIIDEVIRQSPYAPKPAGMVKNSDERAQGGSYAVYWIKDVSAVFARFVAECKRETTTQVTHPLIAGKFKLTGETK